MPRSCSHWTHNRHPISSKMPSSESYKPGLHVEGTAKANGHDPVRGRAKKGKYINKATVDAKLDRSPRS